MSYFGIVVLVVVLGLAFIRLAPHGAKRWHVPVEGAQDKVRAGSALRVISADTGMILAVHNAMLDEPRTKVIAGDPAAGSVTYVSRSLIMGFPDYTTIEQTGNMLKIYGRLRFGKSDFGVNAQRLDRVLAAAGVR